MASGVLGLIKAQREDGIVKRLLAVRRLLTLAPHLDISASTQALDAMNEVRVNLSRICMIDRGLKAMP